MYVYVYVYMCHHLSPTAYNYYTVVYPYIHTLMIYEAHSLSVIAQLVERDWQARLDCAWLSANKLYVLASFVYDSLN